MKKLLTNLAILGVVVGAAVSGASATCIPAKDFNTWDFTAGLYYYVFFAADSAAQPVEGGLPAGTAGAFWQPGNRAGANEGSYGVTQWLNYYTGYGWYLNGNLGDGSVVGCPSTQLVVAVTDPSPAGGSRTDFFVTSANENPPNFPVYALGPNITLQAVPAPQVTAASRSGTNSILDLRFDDPGPGYYSRFSTPATEVITEIVLYQAKGADPGRDVAAWTEIGRFAYAGGATTVPGFTLDCSDNQTTYLAAGLGMTNEYDLAHVSSSVVVECDPNLADPADKFDLIKERGKGVKRGKPFQN